MHHPEATYEHIRILIFACNGGLVTLIHWRRPEDWPIFLLSGDFWCQAPRPDHYRGKGTNGMSLKLSSRGCVLSPGIAPPAMLESVGKWHCCYYCGSYRTWYGKGTKAKSNYLSVQTALSSNLFFLHGNPEDFVFHLDNNILHIVCQWWYFTRIQEQA